VSNPQTEQNAQPPAVREPSHLEDLRQLGWWLALAEADDHSEKARGAASALRLYWAEQMGLSPMAANDIPLIKGRPYIQANVARTLAHRAGYRVEKIDSSAESCTAVISRNGDEIGRATFTMEQAKAAGIVKERSPWQTYPCLAPPWLRDQRRGVQRTQRRGPDSRRWPDRQLPLRRDESRRRGHERRIRRLRREGGDGRHHSPLDRA
jgi:hypothetical protein